MAQSSYTPGSSSVSDPKDKASDQLNKMAGQAEEAVHRVTDKGREMADGMSEVAGNLKGAVEKSMKDQPMATLAIVAAVGLVLGAIWKA
jgi:ElaB/YqjD/DUF883 family membrane-anchored ribosome-binding protein